MRVTIVVFLAMMGGAASVRADDASDAKAIVARAVKAAGVSADGKPVAMTWKDKGTFAGGGFKMPYTADWAFQAPDKYRFALSGDFNGMKVDLKVVVNGTKAWESGFGMSGEITGAKLEHTLGEVYQFHVMSLTPLLAENEFQLSTAGEKDVNGKKTVVVKVTREKRPSISLFFDKDTGLLAKVELKVKDEFQDWKEVLEEAYFDDYKDVGGRKHYSKMRILRDGKSMIETTLSDQKPHEKLDPKLFEPLK